MFNNKTERHIMQEVKDQTGIILSQEQVKKMKFVPDINPIPDMMVLCLQIERKTILIPVKISCAGSTMKIASIKVIEW